MTNNLKNRIIRRAIIFIANNTNDGKQRIASAIIEELKALKSFDFPEADVNQLKQAEYERGVKDGKTIAEHGSVNYID